MASASSQHVLLSPAELAYLHSSLSITPPLRPDGRQATQFRPLVAETGILPGTNGSARVCFADGTEAIVGVKAEVERTRPRLGAGNELPSTSQNRIQRSKQGVSQRDNKEKKAESTVALGQEQEAEDDVDRTGEPEWVEMTVEIPGLRDDDASTVFLAEMLSEALLADETFTRRLWINTRFHWKLYLDILLISPPLSYPLPLLSLTTHLALLATRLPRLKSEGDEDPFFDDDWAASTRLYPRRDPRVRSLTDARPPVTLLVMAVGTNVIFDPAKEELAVADAVLAVSVAEVAGNGSSAETAMSEENTAPRKLKLLSVRTIDPPSRLTPPGVPKDARDGIVGADGAPRQSEVKMTEAGPVEGVWKAPRGGVNVRVLKTMTNKVLEKGGVADEVLDALDGVELD